MKKIIVILFLFIFSPSFVLAQSEGDLSASPGVINDSASPRDILEYSVQLENHTTHKLNIFPLLLDLEESKNSNTEGLRERQYLMTRWMSIKRGSVEIMPGSKISLPLKIDIPNDALPGDYFVSITFAHGAHRLEAEENALKMSPPVLLVNLGVDDQSVEKLSVKKYYPAKKIFINGTALINLDLNNSGTVNLIPTGNIFVYNKRNQEVDAIEINPELKTVPAESNFSFQLSSTKKLRTGKYKARLELDYGDKISRDINDTTYLIVITLPFLLFFGIGILLFIILLSKLIFKKTYHHHQAPSEHHEKVKKVSPKKEEVINLKSK